MSGDWPWSSTANLELFGLLAALVVMFIVLIALLWWLGSEMARRG